MCRHILKFDTCCLLLYFVKHFSSYKSSFIHINVSGKITWSTKMAESYQQMINKFEKLR